MAKAKLFPRKLPVDDKLEPHDRFTDLAKRVFVVPKEEIDKREKKWLRERKKLGK